MEQLLACYTIALEICKFDHVRMDTRIFELDSF